MLSIYFYDVFDIEYFEIESLSTEMPCVQVSFSLICLEVIKHKHMWTQVEESETFVILSRCSGV